MRLVCLKNKTFMNFTKIKISTEKWFFQDMPEMASVEEWNNWATKAQNNKIRWFLTETLPDYLSFRFLWPYERIGRKLKNKYVRKYNLIHIHSLKATEYYGVGDRLLHGMFQLLVDLVELEKAQRQIVWGDENVTGHITRGKDRNPEMGLKYLDWEIALGKKGGVNQSENAKQIKELYIWWTVTRINRIELIDIKGTMGISTNEYYRNMRLENKKNIATIFNEMVRDKDEELYKSVNKAYDDVEEKYEKEDERMLLQLVKLRKNLLV